MRRHKLLREKQQRKDIDTVKTNKETGKDLTRPTRPTARPKGKERERKDQKYKTLTLAKESHESEDAPKKLPMKPKSAIVIENHLGVDVTLRRTNDNNKVL